MGTPEAFALAIREEAFPLDCVDFLVVDECDVCLRPDPDCSALWRAAATSPRRWQTVAVGATVGEEALAFARSFGLLEDPWMVQFGDPQKLPPAMKHRAVVVVRARPAPPAARADSAAPAPACRQAAPFLRAPPP